MYVYSTLLTLYTGRIASASFLMMVMTGVARSARVGGGGHHRLPSASVSGDKCVCAIFLSSCVNINLCNTCNTMSGSDI